MAVREYIWITTYRICQTIIVMLALLLTSNFTYADTQAGSDIRLVLQITIDGLRADLINRHEKGFGKGGFRFLLEKGTYFTNAHYQYANTETIVWVGEQQSRYRMENHR